MTRVLENQLKNLMLFPNFPKYVMSISMTNYVESWVLELWRVLKLIYLWCIRQDINYVVSVISWFIILLLRPHLKLFAKLSNTWKELHRRDSYVKIGDEFKSETYTDLDWVGSTTDGKSTMGFFPQEVWSVKEARNN